LPVTPGADRAPPSVFGSSNGGGYTPFVLAMVARTASSSSVLNIFGRTDRTDISSATLGFYAIGAYNTVAIFR